MKEKEIAIAEGALEKADEIEGQLKEIEDRAALLNKRRTDNTRFQTVSYINNRNRKANVSKAETAIMEMIKQKEEEGVVANPFIRRRCQPSMVTKNEKEEVEIGKWPLNCHPLIPKSENFLPSRSIENDKRTTGRERAEGQGEPAKGGTDETSLGL